MTTEVLTLPNIERKLFMGLATLIGVAVIAYCYAVATLTFSVVERNHLVAEAHEVASNQATLEEEYMNLGNRVTLARAQELGLREVAPKFTSTTNPGLVAVR